jgi:hypothetical protein
MRVFANEHARRAGSKSQHVVDWVVIPADYARFLSTNQDKANKRGTTRHSTARRSRNSQPIVHKMTINPHHQHEMRQNFLTRTVVGFEGKGIVWESSTSTSRLEKQQQPGTIAAADDVLEGTVEPFLADDDSMPTVVSPSSHVMLQIMSNNDNEGDETPRVETALKEVSAARPFGGGMNHNNNNNSSNDTPPTASVSCLLQLHDLLIREEPLKYSIAASGAPAMEQEHPEQERQEEGEAEGDYDDDCLSSYDNSAAAVSGPPAKRPKPTHPVVHSSWSPLSPHHPPRPQETVPTRLSRKSKSKSNNRSNKKSRRGSIVFNETVRVVPIPLRTEYSARVRHRIWSNSDEIQENAVRNTIEFASEGWDWRAVLLDDAMHLCRTTGELIHPIHYEPHHPVALALQHERQQQQQEQKQQQEQEHDIDDGATADSVDSADSSTATASSCGSTSVALSCSSEETTATTTTTAATMTICSYADEY